VPSVASLDELHRAVAGFTVEDPGLVIEPSALATARRSLDESGLRVREISISYGGGSYYNTRPASFHRTGPRRGQVRLHDQQGALVLYLPQAREAVVPQRPWPEGGPP
jgi:hypothetical protein